MHAARLSAPLMRHLTSGGCGPVDAWPCGPDVVIKVQYHDVQALVSSDLRNLGRVARFLRPVLPFDATPIVQVQALLSRQQCSVPRLA